MDLPTPTAILGGLDKVQGNEDPDEDASPCLRETSAHATFLYQFAKTVMRADAFKKFSNTWLLSAYMSTCLEAYAVLTYVNNYKYWKEEASRTTPAGGSVSEVTEPSSSDGSLRLYTATTRGTGKFKGWSDDGIELYNRIEGKLRSQRNDPILSDFDKKLKTKYLTNNDSGTTGGGGSNIVAPRRAANNLPKRRRLEARNQTPI